MMKNLSVLLMTFFVCCSPYQNYFKYEYEQQRTGTIKSLVVTPITMIRARPQGMDTKKITSFETKIMDYLRSNGYKTEPSELLVKNWEQESGKLDGFFNPSTGKLDATKIAICLLNAIRRTREEQKFDAVLFIHL